MDGDNICSNCKNKINSGNLFCSYCGNIISDNLSVDNERALSSQKNEENVINNELNVVNHKDDIIVNQFNEKKSIKKDGIVYSIISFLLFIMFFVPYLIYVVISPLVDAFNGKTVYGYHLAVVIMGGIVFLPTVASFGFGIGAVMSYNKFNKEKNC